LCVAAFCTAARSNVHSFLCKLLADLKAGNSVTILQAKANLTTVEASKLLGMSRQFLIGLLEKGEILFHMVGTHRRVYARDVMSYKARRDVERRKLLDDLVQAETAESIRPTLINPRRSMGKLSGVYGE
jgi:excisionase family DNA binding protein